MPPKPKFTKEEIVAAALELVSANGIEALTARELSAYLGSSARPIFTVFMIKPPRKLAITINYITNFLFCLHFFYPVDFLWRKSKIEL